jgi:crotonobetainyl-CoA:carnitine CoA-transferase CaiB-like acyl-CoA transferase
MTKPTQPIRAPLDGIRVLDLSRIIAGPNCTMTLADLGADVIKIERPGSGDDTRHMRPPEQGGESAFFLAFNRNKRSVAIDMKEPRGLELIKRLIEVCDVLIENFRPGVTQRLGIDYKAVHSIKPNLVYCSISAYGQTGAMAHRPGLDPVLQAEMGLMSITGEADGGPLRHPISLTDMVTSLYASTAICASLVRRAQSNQGEHIDLSLMGSASALLGNMGTAALSTGVNPPRLGNSHPSAVPVGAFVGSDDEHFYLACGNQRLFTALARDALGKEEWLHDARFATNSARIENREVLMSALAVEFKTRSRDAWVELLQAAGVPAGPVRSVVEALQSPEVLEAGLVQTLPHTTAESVTILRSPINLASMPEREDSAPPALGEHTHVVLRELLQISDTELSGLTDAGIITSA